MIRNDERRITDSFELSCWRRLLRIPWPGRIANRSVIDYIYYNPTRHINKQATTGIVQSYHAKRKYIEKVHYVVNG